MSKVTKRIDPSKIVNPTILQRVGSSTTTTLDTSDTSNRIQTLQDTTDTFVYRATTDGLTNKTITGTTNTVDANNLRNGSTYVVSLSGSAPTTNQVLTYNGTNAIWASGAIEKYITISKSTYSTGTAAQATTVITGTSTLFTAAMVGGIIVYSTGVYAFITGYTSATNLSVAESQTVTATTYVIYYGGLQADNSGNASAGTLYNTVLLDSSNQIVNVADVTKALLFSLGGATTGKTMTLTSLHTNNRILTLPDATDTLVARTTTDTLTNKTITGTTNTVDANNLRNGSTYVVGLAGSAPTTNQVLTYNGTNAVWEASGVNGTIQNYIAISPLTYSTGTAAQATTTVTGTSTVFTASMVGGIIVYSTGVYAFITGYTSAINLSVAESQTVTATTYIIYYGGLQADTSGNTSLNAVYNAQLLDSNVNWVNAADNTKKLALSLAGATTGTTLTLASAQTANHTQTLQNVADTFVYRGTTDTLTNKTITGTTNTVDANNLRNGSTYVVGLAGSAPTTNQVLTYNGTNAVWEASGVNGTVQNYIAISPLTYSTGTAAQATTVITGTSTVFTASMVGGIIVYSTGVYAFITGYTSATNLSVAESQTVTATTYIIYYGGLQADTSGNTSLNNVYNAQLLDSYTNIVNTADHTKQLNISLTGATTGKILTLTSNHTLARTQTLQDTTDTFVYRATTDTFTNKTITGTTNTVDANNLRNGSTYVVGLSGSAPTTNQVLTYNGTNAVWGAQGTNGTIQNYIAISKFTYSTGTVAQTTTTVTGTSTTFTAAMVGGIIVYSGGTVFAFVTAFTSTTSLTVAQSQTVSSGTSYVIYYGGFQADTSGNESLNLVYNAQLLDGTTNWVNSADNTKKVMWSLGGATTGTALTLVTSQTANHTQTLQNVADTFVYRTTTDTLTNKILSDSTSVFGNVTDTTKQLQINLGGSTTGTTLTLASAQTANHTQTLQNVADTFVYRGTTDTLTNKTITGTTNTVDANNLRNGSTYVVGLAGSAPTTNQVLTYNGTNAVWASSGTSGTIENYIAISKNTYSTGTVGQTTTTVTGVGTTFTASMVGGLIVYSGGIIYAFITAFGSSTSLTVSELQTVSTGTSYTIYYGGLQADTSGNVGLGLVYNAQLLDSSTAIVNTTDNTKQLQVSLTGATTGTTLTLASSQSANHIQTLQNIADTFVYRTTTDTLTNKILSDSTSVFGNSSDTTKQLQISLGGSTTGTTLTLASAQTANHTQTLQNVADTFVYRGTTDTLTNKTITGTTNTVDANNLRNGSTYVVGLSGSAPTTNQVLTYNGFGNAVWASSGTSGTVQNYIAISKSTYSTGTVGQTTTTVTGVGTTFTAAMVGGLIVYSGGIVYAFITAFGSTTSLTVSESQTVSTGTSYTIYYGGLQADTSGNVGLGTVYDAQLLDSSTAIVNTADNTKQLQISLGGATTGTILTLSSAQTANHTQTLQNVADTFVYRTTTDTLTNKTITGTTNTVDANNLRNGSTYVVSLSGSAPTTNQVLTYNGTNAIWASSGTSGTIENYIAISKSTYSTGTVGQTTTTVTGVGTTFTAAMVGGLIVYSGGIVYAFITTFGSATSLTVAESQTVSTGTSYTIYYGGLQADTSGNVGLGIVYDAQLLDGNVNWVNSLDNTKKLAVSLAGATSGATLTLASSQTANHTQTLQNVADTFVYLGTTDVLTNKTITGTTNTVRATQLATTGSDVVVSGASAPVAGQVLIASSSTTAIWQTLNGTATTLQEVYVNLAGNDSTANGTQTLPFLTVSAAMTFITGASITIRYVIIVGPGTYSNAFTHKANIFIWGSGQQTTIISGNITINDASWSGSNDNRSGYLDVELTGTLTYDFTAQTSQAGKMYFYNTRIINTPVFTAYNAINQAVFQNCQLFAGTTQTGINLSLENSSIYGGPITVNSSSLSNTALTTYGGGINGNVSITQTTGASIPVLFYGTGLGGTLTASGTVAISANISAIPIPANVSLSGGATLTYLNDAIGVNTTNTLTNKTITGILNTVDANNLRNGSTYVVGLGGSAPTTNQVLTYNGTNAVWGASGASGTVQNYIAISKSTYSTGTVAQSTTTVTGTSTTFTAAMVGGIIVYSGGTIFAFITAFTSATSITVAQSQTVSSGTSYTIYYGGFQADTSGNESLNLVYNAQLLDGSTNWANSADNTKKIMWSLGGATTGTTLTLASSQTANHTQTFQNVADTFVYRATTDTLTNKTVTGTTNTVDANNLRNGSTYVVSLSGSAPTTNQVLTYNGSSAVWEGSGVNGTIQNYIAISKSTYNTGTVGQSTTTITGSGTTFTSAMASGIIVYSTGAYAFISGFTSTTVLTTIESQTVSSGTSYTIYYNGLQATNTSGETTVGNLWVGSSGSFPAWIGNGIQSQFMAETYTDTTSSGTVLLNVLNAYQISTLVASSAVSYTYSSTLYIAGPPTSGTNVTQTNPYALLVGSGNTALDGNLWILNPTGLTTPRTITFQLFGGSATTFFIGTDTGDHFWQGGRNLNLQMGAWYGIQLMGNRQTATPPAYTTEQTVWNTQIINTNDTVVLQLYPIASQASDYLQFLDLNGNVVNTFGINGFLGMGQTTPVAKIHLSGAISAAAWGTNGILHRADAATFTDTTSSGTVTNNMVNTFLTPTLAASSTTVYTNAATLYISAAPSAGSHVTITNPFALYLGGNIGLVSTGTTGITTLKSTQTGNVTLSFPNATDTLVGLAATQTLTNKTLTSSTNTILAYPKMGNVITVDGTNGNDSLGTLGGYPFKTITAALAAATSGNTIYIWSGTYTDVGFTIPSGVSVVATDDQNVIVAPAAITTTTTVCTMGTNTQLMGLTFNITSATSGITIICVSFPSTTTASAQLDDCEINITSTASGAITIYGVNASGTGSPATTETWAIRLSQIFITATSAASGNAYALYVSGTNSMVCRDNSFVCTTGSATGVGAVVNNASATLRIKSSGVKGTTNDYLQTAGTIVLTEVDLTSGTILNGNVTCSATAPAAANYLLAATSTSAAAWTNPNSIPAALAQNNIAILTEQQSSGTNAGTFTSGAWQTRNLTNLVSAGSFCTLASNQFTLAIGTYYIHSSAPAQAVGGHQARIQNITASTTTITGTSVQSAATAVTVHALCTGTFTIASSSTFALQHQCKTTVSSTGFGASVGLGTEVYSEVTIIRLV